MAMVAKLPVEFETSGQTPGLGCFPNLENTAGLIDLYTHGIPSTSSPTSMTMPDRSAYQSAWGDHRKQSRHWVSFHTLPQAGHFPYVSKVFQAWPQRHCQLD